MGELWKGVAKECQSVVFVICGTGIGGAVIERGKLDMGVTMNRGEFGNFPMGGYTREQAEELIERKLAEHEK